MLKDIPLHQLAPGMFLERHGDGSYRFPLTVVRDWVHDQARIEELKGLGLSQVTVDVSKCKTGDSPCASPEADPTALRPPRLPDPEASRGLYAHCLSHVSQVLEKVRQGFEVDFQDSFPQVDALMAGVERDAAAMTLLAKLHRHDDYTLRHSLNVSLLALIFGRHLGMEGEVLRRLGFAGLYHDLGKFKVPLDILNKPGKLSDREFAVMQGHCLLGYELLKGQPGVGEDILLGVLHHHERYDGQGYPRRLKADQKDPFSRILTIVDIFDALTSDRAYKKAYTPHDSLKAMFAWRNESFHPGLLEKFVECFGVYPPGSLVGLTDQRAAVVLEARVLSPARPLVKICFDKRLRPVLPEILDLALLPKAAQGGLDIAACLEPRQAGIPVERFV